ncbi:MAG: DUF2891 domain-containing protein [Krumholzibacteria bacterium]|nr:DUF2891 domain-containing protein [Candidatus Krumholzibacteria bacterium]
MAALVLGAALAAAPAARANDADQLAPFVRLALECSGQEYPNKIAHVMQSDADLGTPSDLTPAFYGCFDWHSAVHGHWQLVRFARLFPEHPLAAEARAVLEGHLTEEKLAAETAYLLGEGRASWERPYGLAWLLQLAAELREWDDPDARRWAAALAPLEEACAGRLADWLPKLAYPIRTGEHSQTAFAFGLVLDWARTAGRPDLAGLVTTTGLRLYRHDPAAVLAFEPSGQDFLSPALAEADFLRRVLEPDAFALWLDGFLPEIPTGGGAGWLPVAIVTDRSDGKLAHLDGLNLSRAWMLQGIAAGLPDGDPRITALLDAAAAHRTVALAALTGEHYEGAHWLGTFALYLESGRGLPATADQAR